VSASLSGASDQIAWLKHGNNLCGLAMGQCRKMLVIADGKTANQTESFKAVFRRTHVQAA